MDAMLQATRGMMDTPTYVELRRLASALPRGDVLDVGTGQGATTISYAWGLQDSGHPGRVIAVDQFFQYRAERPHPYTLADNPDDAVKLNIEQFYQNLTRFGVLDRVKILVGTTDQVAATGIPTDSVALLSIDVDGHIDRDLGHFYDFVLPGGLIIIDDYRDYVNANGIQQLNAGSEMAPDDIREYTHSLSRFKARRLLGKHLLTYRLANHLQDIGAIVLEHVIGNATGVFRKASQKSFSEFNLSGIKDIERRIIDEYIIACVQNQAPAR